MCEVHEEEEVLAGDVQGIGRAEHVLCHNAAYCCWGQRGFRCNSKIWRVVSPFVGRWRGRSGLPMSHRTVMMRSADQSASVGGSVERSKIGKSEKLCLACHVRRAGDRRSTAGMRGRCRRGAMPRAYVRRKYVVRSDKGERRRSRECARVCSEARWLRSRAVCACRMREVVCFLRLSVCLPPSAQNAHRLPAFQTARSKSASGGES